MKQVAIRQWRLSDAGDLAVVISNGRVMRSLRDGQRKIRAYEKTM